MKYMVRYKGTNYTLCNSYQEAQLHIEMMNPYSMWKDFTIVEW